MPTLDELIAQEQARYEQERNPPPRPIPDVGLEMMQSLFPTELLTVLNPVNPPNPLVWGRFVVDGTNWRVGPGYGPVYAVARSEDNQAEVPLTNHKIVNARKLLRAIGEWRDRTRRIR